MIRFQRPSAPPGFAKSTPRPRARGPFDETVWKPHKAAFSQAQHGKCGYCESYVAGTQDADVEHYAPKHAVADISDDPATWGREHARGLARLATGTRRTVPRAVTGYWWRAYDWSNYLFACAVCNQKYKGAVFPLAPTPPKRWRPTRRDRKHQALLLNCYDAQAPWRHFDVDPTTGTITGKTAEGTATLATCGLHRETLRPDRQRAADNARRQLDEIEAPQADARSRTRAWRELVVLGAPDAPFAGAVRAVAEARRGLTWEVIGAYVRNLPTW